MTTQCYAMVRGSTLRATALLPTGELTEPVSMAVSRSAVKVTVDEVTDDLSAETLRDQNDDAAIQFNGSEDLLGFSVDIDFVKVDPSLLSLMSGVPVVYNAEGDVVGFDADTLIPATAFALEVWTKLDLQACRELGFGEGDFGEMMFGDGTGRRVRGQFWGHTLFPFLKGGALSGFTFGDGLVTFNLRRAQTHPGPRWAVGPHDLEGLRERLLDHVSRNGTWTSTVLYTAPPEPFDGLAEFEDVINGGDADEDTTDILAGGSAAYTSPWIINGGRA